MGRRKIEIQPITHERNRSVTFLKRKNGLFKKAYELGVLCSVDVAVIIFEEKPGHSVKLYQYSSDDPKTIVQRHIDFVGEKDSKIPSDFRNSKADDGADGEEDEVDDEEDVASRPKKRPENSAKKSLVHKSKPEIKSEAPTTSRITETRDEGQPSPSTSRPRVSSPTTSPVSLPTSGERSSRRSPEFLDSRINKRPRRGSYSEDTATMAARNAMLSSHPHPHHSYPISPQSALGHPDSNSSLNLLFNNPPPIGGQPNHVLELLRNPANMRTLGSYPPHMQGGMYPPRHPSAVSESFLASLSEVAAQQGGVGCGIGGVGGGMNGLEWPGGYPLNHHHGDQSRETWLDFLTGGPSPGSLPPPSHLHHPHAQNHHQWSSASSVSSRRSDSSMSNGGLPLGIGGGCALPPAISGSTRPPSTDILNSKNIL